MLKYTWGVFSIACLLCLLGIFIPFRSKQYVWHLESFDSVFPGFTVSRVQKIVLTCGVYQSILQRTLQGWKLEYRSPNTVWEDYADDTAVADLLKNLSELVPSEPPQIVSKENWSRYGFEVLAKSIQIQYENIRQVLEIGFSLERRAFVYARLSQEDRLLVIPNSVGTLLENVRHHPNTWRNRKVFRTYHKNKLGQWIWKKSGKKLSIFFQHGIWYWQDGNLHDRVNPNRMDFLQNFAEHAVFQDFLTQPIWNNLENAIFLGYQTEQGNESILMIPFPQSNQYYAVRVREVDGQFQFGATYTIHENWIKKIPDDFTQWYDPRIIPTEFLSNCIELRREGSIVWTLQQKEGIWSLQLPYQFELSSQRCKDFLCTIGNLQAQQFQHLEMQAKELLTIVTEKGAEKLVCTLSSDENITWIKSENASIWRGVPNNIAQKIFQANQYYFYNNRVDAFVFSDVQEVRIFSRKYSQWHTFQSPFSENIKNVLRKCAWIMADEVLGDTHEAKKFSCEESVAEMVLLVRTSQKQTQILLGQCLENGGNAIYISGFPYIYALPSDFRLAMEVIFNR